MGGWVGEGRGGAGISVDAASRNPSSPVINSPGWGPTYCGPAALTDSKEYAAAGLEDEACTKRCEKACELFDETFQSAFDDIAAFISGGNAGGQHNFASVGELLKSVRSTIVELSLCVGRWSACGFKENCDDVEITMENILVILKCGSYLLVKLLEESVAPKVQPVIPALEVPQKTPSGDVMAGGAAFDACAQDGDEAVDSFVPQVKVKCEEAQEDTPVALPGGDLGNLAQAAHAFLQPAEAFAKDLVQTVEGLKQLWQTALDRMGDKAHYLYTQSGATAALSDEILKNMAIIGDVVNYIVHTDRLNQKPTVSEIVAYDREPDDAHMESLRIFSRIHREVLNL